MSALNLTGTVTNAHGAVAPISGVINVIDPPVVDGVVVSPPSGPRGTLFTITVNAHDVNVPPSTPLAYNVQVNGVAATPTGAPNVFTWQSSLRLSRSRRHRQSRSRFARTDKYGRDRLPHYSGTARRWAIRQSFRISIPA